MPAEVLDKGLAREFGERAREFAERIPGQGATYPYIRQAHFRSSNFRMPAFVCSVTVT